MNQGSIMDYTRLLGEQVLSAPLHAFLMQDHFLNTSKAVKGDTIPEGTTLDLDRISTMLLDEPKLAVCATRYGYRVVASVPEPFCGEDYVGYDESPPESLPWCWCEGPHRGAIVNGKYCSDHFIYYNGKRELPGSQRLSLAIDGSNFCLDPKWLVAHYRASETNRRLYLGGLGDYCDALVWEGRLGTILGKQGLAIHELSRNLRARTPDELTAMSPQPCEYWQYFYHSPLFYWMLGKDMWNYSFKMTEAYFRFMNYAYNHVANGPDRNPLMRLMADTKGEAACGLSGHEDVIIKEM